MGDMLNTVEAHEETENLDEAIDSIINEVNSEDLDEPNEYNKAQDKAESQDELCEKIQKNLNVETVMPTKEELHEIMMKRVEAKKLETESIISEANKNNAPPKTKAEELREMMERKIKASQGSVDQVISTTVDKNEISNQIRTKISERARERLRQRFRDSYVEKQKERAREKYREGMRQKVREKVEKVAITLLKEDINELIISKSTGLTLPEIRDIKKANNL